MARASSLRALLSTFALAGVVALTRPANAQEKTVPESGPSAATEAEANNPLAKFQAFNIHNYYVPSLSESNGNADTFWLRYAQPFGKFLFRASLPISRVPAGDGTSTSGLSDLNAFAAYLFDTGNPGVSLGAGPQLTVPTATDDRTGTGKWQAGLVATYFNATSKTFQWGGLVTWQTDFAGDASRAGTNTLAVQPFYFVQLGKGTYVRGSAVMVFDLKNGTYDVPVGLGIGQVVPTAGAVFNVFIEPQFTVLSRGPGQPEFQVFVGFNTQFLKK